MPVRFMAKSRSFNIQNPRGEVNCVVKLRLREGESVNDAVKRFRKLVEHSGIKKKCAAVNTTRSQAKQRVGIVAGQNAANP